MLVISRKGNQAIKLGKDITITVVEIKGTVVKLGIEAPDEVSVTRLDRAYPPRKIKKSKKVLDNAKIKLDTMRAVAER